MPAWASTVGPPHDTTGNLSGATGTVTFVTPDQVAELVKRLQAAFPDPPMSDETRKVYERLLTDLEYAETDAAVDTLIMTAGKLPTIGKIRRTVIEPLLDLPSADEAWVAIQSRQQDLNPLVARAATLMGGTFNVRTSSDPELTRVRFVKAYEELRRKIVDAAVADRARRKRMRIAS